MVSYPVPGFLSSATWPSLPKKHYNGLCQKRNIILFSKKKSIFMNLLFFWGKKYFEFTRHPFVEIFKRNLVVTKLLCEHVAYVLTWVNITCLSIWNKCNSTMASIENKLYGGSAGWNWDNENNSYKIHKKCICFTIPRKSLARIELFKFHNARTILENDKTWVMI